MKNILRENLLVGLLFVLISFIGFIADLDGFIQFFQKYGIPNLLINIVMYIALIAFAIIGVYLLWLWYAEQQTEPIRQILRASADPAVENLQHVSNKIYDNLRKSHGNLGHAAAHGLGICMTNVGNLKLRTSKTLEHPSYLGRLRFRVAQREFADFLNAYEGSITYVRDCGTACSFDFKANGNFPLWKRHDEELLSSLHKLIIQTRYAFLHQELGYNTLKEGFRNFDWSS